MSLIKEKISLPVSYSITGEITRQRNALVASASEVKSVVSAESNSSAGDAVRNIRKYVKDVEASRVALTKPLLDAQRLLKTLADDHCAPLVEEQKRIERMATNWIEAENRRVAREEQERQEVFQRAEKERIAAEEKLANNPDSRWAQKKAEQTELAVQAAIAAPAPQVERAHGQQTRKVLRWEVTDINLLVKARPDLCRIEPKASAIQSCCVPEMPIPGLRLFWETQSVFTSR